MRTGKFSVYQDNKDEWRFNLKASNGEIIAVSEGYKSKAGCLNGIVSIKKNAGKAPIDIMDGGEISTRYIKKDNKNTVLPEEDLVKTMGKVQYTWKVVK